MSRHGGPRWIPSGGLLLLVASWLGLGLTLSWAARPPRLERAGTTGVYAAEGRAP